MEELMDELSPIAYKNGVKMYERFNTQYNLFNYVNEIAQLLELGFDGNTFHVSSLFGKKDFYHYPVVKFETTFEHYKYDMIGLVNHMESDASNISIATTLMNLHSQTNEILKELSETQFFIKNKDIRSNLDEILVDDLSDFSRSVIRLHNHISSSIDNGERVPETYIFKNIPSLEEFYNKVAVSINSMVDMAKELGFPLEKQMEDVVVMSLDKVQIVSPIDKQLLSDLRKVVNEIYDDNILWDLDLFKKTRNLDTVYHNDSQSTDMIRNFNLLVFDLRSCVFNFKSDTGNSIDSGSKQMSSLNPTFRLVLHKYISSIEEKSKQLVLSSDKKIATTSHAKSQNVLKYKGKNKSACKSKNQLDSDENSR